MTVKKFYEWQNTGAVKLHLLTQLLPNKKIQDE